MLSRKRKNYFNLCRVVEYRELLQILIKKESLTSRLRGNKKES